MPDMDVPIYSALAATGENLPATDVGHRVFLHNIWIILGFFVFFAMFYYLIPYIKMRQARSKSAKSARKLKSIKSILKMKSFGKIFLILLIGWSIHLLLDAVLTGLVMPFYPLNDYMLNYNLVGKLGAITGLSIETMLISLDALLLIFWLWHEEFTHKIVDYF
jgi:membrane-bound metal-dependent hydrolase YbcI (DUF457 family)